MKTTIKRISAIVMAIAIIFSLAAVASAATVPNATIDFSKRGSIDLYKYDLTRANTDDAAAAMIDSYVSTGVRDTAFEAVMDDGTVNDLGNGQTSYGYAIKGVEFRYLRVAEIVTYSETEANGIHKDMVLYKFDDSKSGNLLSAIGLTNNDAYHVTAEFAEAGYHFFESDTLIDALSAALASTSTTVKNALETYMNDQRAAAMPETDEHGHTSASNLELGLYLLMESKVPEMVTTTVDPFFISVPMTTVNGTNASNGGQEWLYNVTVYPKNQTGIPTLEKTLRENKEDTGKNDGSQSITDGYDHNATGSDGDVIDYQIISKLPAITCDVTSLTTYTFVDTLSRGIEYNKNDIVIEFFKDQGCTDKIATWKETDTVKKFSVEYAQLGADLDDATTMTITMTTAGLNEINHATSVYTAAGALDRGYSSCYLRITYQATVNSSSDVVYGDDGNPNTVVLTWQRSNMSYYDTLVDDCHFYTYVLDATKEFSDGKGDFSKVNFKVQNTTDGYWVKARLESDGLYYVTDHVAAEEDATVFVPNSETGKLLIYGLEDDTYIITEVQTDNGYTLLRDGITMVIYAAEDDTRPCGIYGSDVLGLVQNDPRYKTFDGYKELAHVMLTASATIDNDAVQMEESEGSDNAMVPVTVINTRGPELPRTGDNGVWRYSVYGILLMAAAAFMIVLIARKKNTNKQ